MRDDRTSAGGDTDDRALRSLRAERERTQMFLDLAEAMFIALDAEGNVTLANRRACEVLGYSEDELLGKNWFDTCLPERLRDTVKEVSQALLRGDVEPVEYFENPIVTRSGEERNCTWHNTVLRDDSGAITGHLSSGEDITEVLQAQQDRARLEEQLQTAQRMEAIGRLAAGVAHDFNNVLTVVSANASLALEDVPRSDPTRESLEEIVGACQQAAGLTRQLLAFARKQVIAPQVIDLGQLLGDLRKMLDRLLGEDIDLRTGTEAGLGRVLVDPSQAEQVVLNLAINARAAMPDGGTLTLATANVRLDDRGCSGHADAVPGDYVALTVKDTGVGMDACTRRHIFEPFFSTRRPGEGTGLGLATVYGIVTQHGGWIEVDSTPGAGSTFTVYLPAVDDTDESSIKLRSLALDGGPETVLAVEDDPRVLRLLERLLERLGYQVLTAGDGNAAIERVERHEGPIDLLLTDVVMPGMNGRELADRLTDRYPDLAVIYISGYTDDVIAHHGVLDDGVDLVPKPFSPRQLATRVREVLDRRGS